MRPSVSLAAGALAASFLAASTQLPSRAAAAVRTAATPTPTQSPPPPATASAPPATPSAPPATSSAPPATSSAPATTPPAPPAPPAPPPPTATASAPEAASPSPTPSGITSPSARPTPARSPSPAVSDQPSIPESLDDDGLKATARRPIAALAQVRWMTGSWTARSSEQTSNGTSRLRAVTAYVFGFTMKGRWLFGADGKSRDFLYLTYDPYAERWIALRFEGSPSYGMWFSDNGWQSNRIEFSSGDSYVDGLLYHRRMTIVRKGARRFGIYTEEQLADGTWIADDAVELTKAK